MENTPIEKIESLVTRQRFWFKEGNTRSLSFRRQQLQAFKEGILKYEKQIADALWIDLHKSYEEAWLTEISMVLQEIDLHLHKLNRWCSAKRVKSSILLRPSKSRIVYEPLGVALIIAPWNYPFQLLMNPLVGAISSGCCAVLKSSPYTPTVAKVMDELIANTFIQDYICITHGDREVNTELLRQRFDLIFFTGSPALGKVVMKAAAEHLTPVVLELGGKSPCIVEVNANLEIAAKRIAWGKFINAGQTCIAPDYLFVHNNIKEQFIEKLIEQLEKMYGSNFQQSRFYPRIVTHLAVERLQKLMHEGVIRYGGQVDVADRYIAPTIIDQVKPEHAIMQEEIFGPLFPVMTFNDIKEVTDYVNAHEKPLALYYFGNNDEAKRIMGKTSSGGVCINDTIMHVANHNLPFGGVGNSGMGSYHGKESFLAFSHCRAVVESLSWFDLPLRYVPFKYFNLIKKLL